MLVEYDFNDFHIFFKHFNWNPLESIEQSSKKWLQVGGTHDLPALLVPNSQSRAGRLEEWKNSLWPMLLATANPVVSSFSRRDCDGDFHK